MSYDKGVLTISEWSKGAQTSPLQGFSSIVNCDINDTEGVLKIATELTNTSTTGLLVGSVVGQDIIAWKNYIFVTYGITGTAQGAICVYGPLNAPGLFTNWQTTLSYNFFKKMCIGTDGI